MARTTLDIDKTVLQQLRRRADAERKSMGQVASEVLAHGLEQTPRQPEPLRWPSVAMGRPKVDLEDKDALWTILDAEQVDDDPA